MQPNTTTYYLPSLKFLRRRRIIVTSIYAFLFYVMYIAFLFHIIYLYAQYGKSYYTIDIFGSIFLLFLLASISVLYQLRRIALAFVTKRRALEAGTTVPNFESNIDPVEASVLIDAQDAGELAYLLIDDVQKKGALRAWRDESSMLRLQRMDATEPLNYYEQAFISLLFQRSDSLALTDRQLKRHRAVRRVQKVIYMKMRERGYFGKMYPLQEFFHQYFQAGSIVFSYTCYLFVAFAMVAHFIQPLIDGPFPLGEPLQVEWIVMMCMALAYFLLAPLFLLFSGAYSSKGSKAYREVYGLYWFLTAVYGHRLAKTEYLSASEREKYIPYAKAFGIPVGDK